MEKLVIDKHSSLFLQWRSKKKSFYKVGTSMNNQQHDPNDIIHDDQQT